MLASLQSVSSSVKSMACCGLMKTPFLPPSGSVNDYPDSQNTHSLPKFCLNLKFWQFWHQWYDGCLVDATNHYFISNNDQL
jgi:predicted small lipoprotein YifL